MSRREWISRGGRVVVAIAVSSFGRAALAQSSNPSVSPHVDVWGALTRAVTVPAGELASRYSPPLLFTPDFTSSGGQILILDGDRGIGFQGGVNVFGPAHVGVQIFVDRTSTDLSGINGPYTVALTYISRPPPNSEPQTVDLRTSLAWPDTIGSLEQLAIGLNGVVRAGRADTVNATLSGGLTYYRVNGTAQSLGYTTFQLGGHSVLFSDEYHLAVSLEPTHAIGFNVGGDFDIPLGRRVALVAGYRCLAGPTVNIPVRLTTIVNSDRVINQLSVADIARVFAPGPARVSITASRIVIGIKITR